MVSRRLPRLLSVLASAGLTLSSSTAFAQGTEPTAPTGTGTAGGASGGAPVPVTGSASGSTSVVGAPSGSLLPASSTSATANGDASASTSTGDQAPAKATPQTNPDGSIGARPGDVYSEDWWSHTRPIVELHGYFRTRGELFHNFSLGRFNAPGADDANLWAQPLDNSFSDQAGQRHQVLLCGDPSATGPLRECTDKSQAHANLRLRLNPEIHISDNLRVMSQIDLLDNLVLGSTPDSYAMRPSGSSASGYSSAFSNGYAPLGSFSNTQGPPTAGVNGYQNSIAVQRAWAEYQTPVGQVRFGRMPQHWGLGMLYNAGNAIDQDWQSNIDRIMFVSGLKSLDLYVGGSWDFVSTGPTNATPATVYGGQPYNTANLANVAQWSAFVARRMNPEMERLKLAKGGAVLNGGLYAVYRRQLIDIKPTDTPVTVDTAQANNGFERRGAEQFVPDLWVQLLWNKLRVEAEAATIWGSVENSPAGSRLTEPTKIRMWGVAAQTELRAVEDKLRVSFGAGWASGDPNIEGLAPGASGLQPRLGEGPISTFRFHPAYNIDYIFFRRILTRIQGAYYLRPSVEYDFMRNPNGQKIGGGAAVIWSRASEFVQAPGNMRDLGVELDAQLYYQAKDGSLNDDPSKLGGFYAALQYGVFFPLGGLEYLPKEKDSALNPNWDLGPAQTVRLILGVLF